MVDGQIRTFDVTDRRVIQAFLDVPREDFLPEDLRRLAYSDASLGLPTPGAGTSRRMLLQPMHLARLLQGAEIAATHRVLVVAGETGYAAALVAHLAERVVSLECHSALAAEARRLAASGGRVEPVSGPLPDGSPAQAPYDVILVQGAAETGLDQLVAQLAPGGRLVAIEPAAPGSASGLGRAVRLDRSTTDVSRRVLFDAAAPILPEFRQPAAFAF